MRRAGDVGRRAECIRSATFAGLLVWLGEERRWCDVCDACARAHAYACVCTYMILNPQRKRVERHNESTSALPMDATRMRIMNVHTPQSTRYTNIHTYACVICVSCVFRGRIDREAKRVRGTSSQPRYRTICLENNGNARRTASGWIFKN